MRSKHLRVGLVLMALFVITVSANDRAECLMRAVAVGETNQLAGLVDGLESDGETIDYLVQKVVDWGADRHSPRNARQALRVLVAAKAPQAVDWLLGPRTSWLIDDVGSTTEPIPVAQENHVKALIAIGEPSVRAILSDRYIGSEEVKEGRAYEYAVVIVGVEGADGARGAIAEALRQETRGIQRGNLTVMSAMIDRVIKEISAMSVSE